MQKSVASRICVVLLISFLVVSLGSMWQGGPVSAQTSGSWGYTSAFEGPKAQFYGVTYNNKQYTGTQTNGASEHEFDSYLHFDPDGISSGLPKIDGEMTSIFVPEQSLTVVPAWMPISWLQDNSLIQQDPDKGIVGTGGMNPPWTWAIGSNNYTMQEWDMRYYISLSAGWSGSEAPTENGVQAARGDIIENVFQNVGVWIKLDISPTWYIQGGGTAYFAIAECTLAENAIMNAKDNNGASYSARTDESVSPESRQSIIELFYSPWGASSTISNDPMTYEGLALNPAYFVNSLYMHVDLNNFGVATQPVNLIGRLTKGDVATFAFDFKVFVFGQYLVKDIQNNPSQYGRFTPVTTTSNWFQSIIGWLSNPGNIALLTTIGIFILVLVFAPWILVVIAAILMGGKKR